MNQEEKKYPRSKGYLLIDTKKCSGCMSCMMACSLAHDGAINLGKSRIQIMKNPWGTYPDHDIKQFVCRQCEDPDCLKACPVGAMYVDEETGIRMINQEKCIGCGKCRKACKYQPTRIVMDLEKKVALKCDLCTSTPYWNEEGGIKGKHACMEVCSLKAIEFTTEMPETEDAYEVNLRKSLHYARALFPIDDEGMQPAKEAVAAAGLRPVGESGAAWASESISEEDIEVAEKEGKE